MSKTNVVGINEIDFTPPVRNKKGRRKKLYLVLDCETATLPFIKDLPLSAKQRQNLSIAKPLIYDLGWKVVDREGNIYSQHSFLIQETFFVPQVFNTAYYASKRPMYMERYQNGEIICKSWSEATQILVSDLEQVDISLAYNAMFDFKKAIPFTERYINALYSSSYQIWEDRQRRSCDNIIDKVDYDKPEFDGNVFIFRNAEYPIADLWGLSCQHLINEETYKIRCLKDKMVSASGLYFKTSAETTFRYLIKEYGFTEEHTALSDTIIETQILLKILKKVGIKTGIESFPYKNLGETGKFIISKKDKKYKKKISPDSIRELIDMMYEKSKEYDPELAFVTVLQKNIIALELHLQEVYQVDPSEKFFACYVAQLTKELKRKTKYALSLKKGGVAWQRAVKQVNELKEEIENILSQYKRRRNRQRVSPAQRKKVEYEKN